eukprot:gene33863-40970_t
MAIMAIVKAEKSCDLVLVTEKNGVVLNLDKDGTTTDYLPFKSIVCGKMAENGTFHVHFPVAGQIPAGKGGHYLVSIHLHKPSTPKDPKTPSITLPEEVSTLHKDYTSQYHVSTTLRVGEWFDQMPIGNGHLGALVGGSATQEIIPMSMAGIFAFDKNRIHGGDYDGYEQYRPNGHGMYGTYKRARQVIFDQGDCNGARGVLSNLEGKHLGTFQGTFDLVLRYSSKPIKFREASDPAPQNKVDYKIPGRGTLMQNFQHLFTTDSLSTKDDVIHYSGGHLDLLTGLAQQTLLTTHGTSSSSSSSGSRRVSLAVREWFASELYDVLVGSWRCDFLDAAAAAGGGRGGCVNLALQLARGADNPRMAGSVQRSVQALALSAAQRAH